MGVSAGLMMLNLGAGAMKASAEKKAAQNEQILADFQSNQLRVNAGQAQASAQREAISIDRETQLHASRALAVAASSGGGASDPTVVNLLAQGAADGAYRKAVALYEGDDQARSLNLQAQGVDTGAAIAQAQSKSRQRAMLIDSAASAAGSYARGTSVKGKYG